MDKLAVATVSWSLALFACATSCATSIDSTGGGSPSFKDSGHKPDVSTSDVDLDTGAITTTPPVDSSSNDDTATPLDDSTVGDSEAGLGDDSSIALDSDLGDSTTTTLDSGTVPDVAAEGGLFTCTVATDCPPPFNCCDTTKGTCGARLFSFLPCSGI